jgi:hypothetical protein
MVKYYPPHQILTGLYTNGNEFLYSNNTPYRGPYYEISTGQIFSGIGPNDPSTEELFEVTISTEVPEQETNLYSRIISNSPYVKLVNDNTDFILMPKHIVTLPTIEDYNKETFIRYFCKKINELIYIEIDKEQYDLITSQSDTILWQLYTPFELNWAIAGNKQQVAIINKNVTELISQRLQLFKFGDYLKHDYLKYYQ